MSERGVVSFCEGGFRYERVAMTFFSGDGRPHMVALCAEPGMGREDIITEMLERATSRGSKAIRRDFSPLSPETASRQLTKLARDAARRAGGVVVGIDNMPASDEACVARQVRALRKMWVSGTSVIFSLAPEAGQLLESLPECVTLTSHDLLIDLGGGAEGSRSDVQRLTRGIPSLVKPLVHVDAEDAAGLVLPGIYYDALGRLMSFSLRPCLSDEELRTRLAMMLLGRGDEMVLADVLGFVPRETLVRLGATAPFFGISGRADSFSCILSTKSDVLSTCLPELNRACALFPDVLAASVRALILGGSIPRAALLCRMLGYEGAIGLVVDHGVEFVEAGEAALVKRALNSAAGQETDNPADEALRHAMKALGTRDVRAALEMPVSPGDKGCADALMLAEARCALRGGRPGIDMPDAMCSTMGRRLLAHCEVFRLMLDGHLSAAMRVLVANPCAEGPMSVSKALLGLDFEMVRLLLCDSSISRGRVGEIREFLGVASMAGLHGYLRMTDVVRAIMTDDSSKAAEAETLVARAERAGDTVVQVVALLAGCIFDLKKGASARANVRSMLASAIAGKAGMGYLARVAQLLGQVARFLLGERLAEGARKAATDDLGRLWAIVDEVTLSEEEPLSDDGPVPDVPRDALWLLLVLSEGMGEFSDLLSAQIPQQWARAVAALRRRDVSAGTPGAVDVPQVTGGTAELSSVVPGSGEEPIEVCLLGGFTVRVRGVRVADWKLDQRGAKSLFEYLLLRRGASAKRYQIVEQIWPESDYNMGFNRVYQATSALRGAISEVEAGLDPFVPSRSAKAVTLDMGIIRCDVDAFRAFAREASDCQDDVRTVVLARQVERLYEGDLYMPPMDATGYVASVRSELRALYADAMVAGGDAALRLGQERTAARLALDALAADDLREDAVIVLVRALKASGRTVEAEHQYRQYSRRLAKVAGRSPSRQLRQLMGEGTPALPEAREK